MNLFGPFSDFNFLKIYLGETTIVAMLFLHGNQSNSCYNGVKLTNIVLYDWFDIFRENMSFTIFIVKLQR